MISTQQGRGTYIWEQPSAETTQVLRQHALEGLVRRCLHQASRLGFSSEEVQVEFLEQLQPGSQVTHRRNLENRIELRGEFLLERFM